MMVENTHEIELDLSVAQMALAFWELPPQLQTKEELINNFRDYIQDFERAILEINDTHRDIVLDKML